MRTEMDVLVLENLILLKEEQGSAGATKDWGGGFEPDRGGNEDVAE